MSFGCRDAGGGGAGVPPPSQVLGYQLTLFGPRGADCARHITTGPLPPIFLDDAAPLIFDQRKIARTFLYLIVFLLYKIYNALNHVWALSRDFGHKFFYSL